MALAQNRRARVAVAALFLSNGAIFANLLTRYPEIKADLQLSNAVYGAALAAFSAGALVAGLAAATLIRRYRSSRVAVVGTIGIGAFVVVAGIAPTPLILGAALFVAGASDAITDVAQNAHGLRLQRHYGRSIINSFHAVLGRRCHPRRTDRRGGDRAAHLARNTFGDRGRHIRRPRPDRLPLSVEKGPDHDSRPSARTGSGGVAGLAVYATLLALVVIAVAGATVEDAGSSWATLYLRDSLGAPGAVAVFGYVALVGFMFIGRLIGDRLVDRFGERAVARTGGLITAVGMGTALAFPSTAGTVAGFAAAGFGVATLIPAAMHSADQLPGLRPGSGLTVVTWLMRIGFFGAPLIVGVIADATSLRIGLLSVPVAGLTVIVLAGALSARPRPTRS